MEKINEIPIVEEVSIRIMTYIGENRMELPNSLTKDSANLLVEFLTSSVAFWILYLLAMA
jgi:hypothetical protein